MSITTNHIPVSVSTPQPPTPSPSALQPSSSPAPSSSNLDAPHPGLTISSEQVNAVLFNYLVESGIVFSFQRSDLFRVSTLSVYIPA